MNPIHFKTKLILLAVLPIFLVSMGLSMLLVYYSTQLYERHLEQFTHKLSDSRREELSNYMKIALSAVKPVYEQSSFDDVRAKNTAKDILRKLRYGQDGYFFIHDYRGNTVLHPIKPHWEGKSMWDYQDARGNYLVRDMVRDAKGEMGRYTQYIWHQPSSNEILHKMTFSISLDKWQWVLSTGVYTDEDTQAVAAFNDKIQANIYSLRVMSIGFSLLVTIIVGFFALRVSARRSSFASSELQHLTLAFVQDRQADRKIIVQEIHKKVVSQLRAILRKTRSIDANNKVQRVLSQQLLPLQTTLDNTTAKLISITNKIHPHALEEKGIYLTVEALLNYWSKMSKVKFNLKVVDASQRPPLRIETAFYHIVRECIDSVVLSSDSTQADIRLRYANNNIVFTLQSDGVFPEVAEPDSSFQLRTEGLPGARLQTELLNGTFMLSSAPGTGTSINISLPLA